MSDKPDWIADARALCDAATPGEWRTSMSGYGVKAGHGDDTVLVATFPGGTKVGERFDRWLDDAEFIATARTALPRALTALEAADALVEALGEDEADGDLRPGLATALAAYRKARG